MKASCRIWLVPVIGVTLVLTCLAQDEECIDRDFCEEGWKSWCSDERMKTWCPKLCGECTVTTTSTLSTATTAAPCVDDYTQCPSWKSYCEGNVWTQENCKKTCDLCGKSWSECTKTCGNGTRYKEECDENGKCAFVFEACANTECSEVTCFSPKQKRYGISHACCDGEILPEKSRCGQTFSGRRVSGGENAKLKEWPWMVAIAMPRRRFCAAVIIGKKYLLSAAHCFADAPDKLYDTTEYKLYSGILRLSNSSSATKLEIEKVTVHPEYQFPALDIAIVQLKESLKFTSTIQPICLPGGEVTRQDATCYVTGWGISDRSGGGITDHLQQAPIQNLDRRICRNVYGVESLQDQDHKKLFLRKDEGFLCAGSMHTNVDSCGGDSGGPLVCQRCSSCTWYLAGIVSFGSLQCGTIGIPAVYSEVRAHEDWINQVTGISHPGRTCSSKVGP